jgi:hypothetical protein
MARTEWLSSFIKDGFCEGWRFRMRLSEALEEAYKRWGESAAIHRDRSRQRAHYEVGYFRRKSDGLVFYVMGGGSSLEQALATVHDDDTILRQGEPDAQPAGPTD